MCSALLDGETIAGAVDIESSNVLLKRARLRGRPTENTLPVSFVAFDLLWLAGADLEMPQSLPSGLVVYTCAEWGARPPRHASNNTIPSDMVVQHMDTENRLPLADHSAAVRKAFEIARRCQNDHMDHNGWADSGQHFTVTIDGVCLEGRHGSLTTLLAGHCIRGAHAADVGVDDNDSWGTEHEGTYDTTSMPGKSYRTPPHLLMNNNEVETNRSFRKNSR
jgi:hypothetical protein